MTESSLGDGIFDGVRFLEAGGVFGVGTDSNIRISLAEELRTLEYSQRLRDRARAVLAAPGLSTGRRLYEGALAGGARASGRDTGAIRPGAWADLVSLDAGAPDLLARAGDMLLDSFVFARGDAVDRVWSAGRPVVRGGRHVAREGIASAYAACMQRLKDVL